MPPMAFPRAPDPLLTVRLHHADPDNEGLQYHYVDGMLFDEGGVTFAYGPQAIHRRENNGPWDLVLGPAEFPDHVNVISIDDRLGP